MASITSLSNSSYSNSIYGSRNVLSGLASGMDTEQMIENAVSGYKLKIQNLQKKRTKIEWQQEAYRNIIDKAVDFNRKYTSYSSKTNLLSQSFFSNAVTTAVNGTYKDKISASGKTSSDIQINAVKQMASAATYTVSGLAGQTMGKISGEAVDLSAPANVSTISGSMTIKYGGTNGTSFDISFGELENIDEVKVYNDDGTEKQDASRAEKLAQAINNKLGEITYNYTDHGLSESKKANQVVRAVAGSDGTISLVNQLDLDAEAKGGKTNGNSVTISSVRGSIGETLGIQAGDDKISISYDTPNFVDSTKTTAQYLSGKKLDFSLNGVNKTVTLGEYGEGTTAEDVLKDIQGQLDKAYGTDKIKVSNTAGGGKLALSFDVKEQGSTLGITGEGLKSLGLQEDGAYNYVNTSKKLGDLLGDKAKDLFSSDNLMRAVGSVRASGSSFVDSVGNTVQQLKDEDGNAVKDKDGNDIYYRVNKDGEALYDFNINDAHIAVTKDTTLESLINSVNSNADAGVKISYSKMTNEFKFTATEMGSNSKIEFGGMGKALFGDTSASVKPVDASTSAADLLGNGYNYGGGYANFTMNVAGQGFSVHVDENSTIESIVTDLNDMLSAVGEADEKYKGVQASFDAASGSIVFKDADGKAVESSAGNNIAKDLLDKAQASVSKSSYVQGKDAIMDVTVNGKRFDNLVRSSNSFDIDGMTINVKGTFNEDGSNVDKDGNAIEAVSFTTSTDSDKIVDVIKSFVEDYNAMATEIKNAYSTMPQTNTSGNRYEPLTAEEEDKYSESELKAYYERAKQGVLFGDSTLSTMYSKLLSAISPTGADGVALREIGIDTSFSGGMTTLSLDEDKLRSALESDPDKVKNVFTKTKESGSSTNGLMQNLQNTLNAYVKDTGEPKGILITHAGSAKAPTSLNSNSLKSQMDALDDQIDRWTDKMSSQIDRYTSKFSKLEQLIAQMNSQSSAFSGLMGGSSGY